MFVFTCSALLLSLSCVVSCSQSSFSQTQTRTPSPTPPAYIFLASWRCRCVTGLDSGWDVCQLCFLSMVFFTSFPSISIPQINKRKFSRQRLQNHKAASSPWSVHPGLKVDPFWKLSKSVIVNQQAGAHWWTSNTRQTLFLWGFFATTSGPSLSCSSIRNSDVGDNRTPGKAPKHVVDVVEFKDDEEASLEDWISYTPSTIRFTPFIMQDDICVLTGSMATHDCEMKWLTNI